MSLSNPARIFTLLLFVFAAGVFAEDEQPISLRPKFVEGHTSRYEVWTLRRNNVNLIVGERTQSHSTQMVIDGEITWSVDKVADDGSATCSMTIDWLKVVLTATNGKEQIVDSRQGSGDNEPMHLLLQSMSGVALSMSVAADGSITAVQGVDAIRSAAGDGGNVPKDQDFIESASDLATLPYAAEQMVMGSVFDAKFSWLHDMGTLHHDAHFTLKSIEEIAGIAIATVHGEAELELEPDLSKMPPGGPDLNISLEHGSVVSQVMFDLERGEAVSRNSKQKTFIRVEIPVPKSNQVVVRTMEEVIQSQALRIAEE
jgi:hypothetical protein